MKKDPNKTNNTWQDPQQKSIIELGLWFIFIIIVIIFVKIVGINNETEEEQSNSNKTTEVTKVNYDTMIKNILLNNYAYEYIIVENDIITKYYGQKINQEELGFKESNEEVIKYYINYNNYYQINIDQYKVIEDPLNIRREYIDLSSLFNLLPKQFNNEEKNDQTIYHYFSEEKVITIYTDANNINEIQIKGDNYAYTLKYSKIGQINNLDKPLID